MKDSTHRNRATFFGVAVVLVFWLFLAAGIANAHPYASGITNSSGTISFILNEAANDVQVSFNNGSSTNDLGALGAGINSFSLGGHTNFAIIVSKTGSGAPSQISVNAALTTFYGPRAVAVNRNPKTHNFGRTYVLNANSGSAGGRTTSKGVYVLNADQSDALGYGATANPPVGSGANQIQYGSSTTYGPFKISVGPDDSVYVADASGALGSGMTVGGGVWVVGSDLTTVTDLFTYNGTSTGTGLVCVAGTPNVTGSLVSNNLVLYTYEWNRSPYNSIWKYQIGNGPLPWTTSPTQLANVNFPTINEVTGDLCIAPDGKFFAAQDRSNVTDTNSSLRVYASDGVTQLWDSHDAAGGANDPFVNTLGMAVSSDDQYVVTDTATGNINVCQLTNGLPNLATFTSFATGSTGNCYGIGWDAADNIYEVSGNDNFLRVFSLGLSTINTTGNDSTGTNGTFQFALLPTPPIIGAQPQSEYVLIGSNASFSVGVTGSTPLGYQWSFNNSNLTDNAQVIGSHSNTLSLTAVSAVANDGGYQVVITNSYGSATSTVATLSVVATLPLPLGWSQFTNSPGPNNVRHDDIYFTDPTNGIASQDNLIYMTTNGGATWTTNFNSTGTHFRSATLLSPTVGFAGNLGVGSYDGGVTDTNVLYATHNGGVTWTNVDGFAEAGMKGLCAIFVLDSQHIYGAGRVRGPAYFIKSVNGGTNWSILSLTSNGIMNGIMDVYFKDTNNGWVVGMDTNQYASPPYYGRIARTTNGGATWTTVLTTPVSNSYFWKMSWPATNIGYVALQQNASFNNVIFYKTTDGGNTWASNYIPLSSVGLTTSQFYLQGLGFVSTNEGWIGGASGVASYTNSFLHTVDGGVTWTSAGFNDTFLINRIRFMNPNLGFAAGANLYIYNEPLVVTGQSSNQVALAGNNLSLSVTAASLSPVSYQWQLNGTNIGNTNSVLSLTNLTRSAEGSYAVILTNAYGSAEVSNITVRVVAAERLSAPRLLPGGQLQLLFDDADGGALLTTNDIATFQVLVSTNLMQWTVLTNSLSVTNGSMLLQDTWTNSGNRFYKVVEH